MARRRRQLIAIIPDRGQEYIGWGKGTKRFHNHLAKRVSNKDGSFLWKQVGWRFNYRDLEVIQDPHNPRQILVYYLRRTQSERKPKQDHKTPELQTPSWFTELVEQFSVK